MARLRVNNQSGSLSGTLAAGATTISFAVAPGFPTIASPDYVAIVLDYGTTSEEIVWMTAYTASATTGTIVRGQEGSSNVNHNATPVKWVHGPTAQDFFPSAGELLSRFALVR